MQDLRGYGFWYDRQKKKYIPIEEHTEAVLKNLERYRVLGVDLGNMKRDTVIPIVCGKGFIRIRYIPKQATLGWQFAGEPLEAFTVLGGFIKKYEIGITTQLTFTDFGLGMEVQGLVGQPETVRQIITMIATWETTRMNKTK